MILDLSPYEQRVQDGLLSRVDDGPLSIYNYTPKCQYSGAWDEYTLRARGLIVVRETGHVVALPFPKFFNHFEEGPIPDRAPDAVTVKLDGFLGIGFVWEGQVRWATRGTFFSEHAAAMQTMWDRDYGDVQWPASWTMLVEAIHPVGRNVIRYGWEGFRVLGIRGVCGYDMPLHLVESTCHGAGLPCVERAPLDYIEAVNSAAQLDDQHEGYVLRWGNYRVKVKSAEYCKVARLLQGLNTRAAADLWYHGTELPSGTPEETRDWIDEQHLAIEGAAWSLEEQVLHDFHRLDHLRSDRKAFAITAKASTHFPLLMQLFADKAPDYRLAVYRDRFPKQRPRKMVVDQHGSVTFKGGQ